jgi:hypothetical protein
MANILEISPSQLIFLGDEIDVTRTIEFVTTCALGTAAMDSNIRSEDVVELTKTMETTYHGPQHGIFSEAACRTFANVIENPDKAIDKLRARTAAQAAGGNLTVKQYLKQAALLTELEDTDLTLIDKNGLLANAQNGRIQTAIHSVYTEAEVPIQQLATKHHAHHYAWQAEVIYDEASNEYYLQSDRQHVQIGNLVEDGSFEPVLTILDSQHTARQPKTNAEPAYRYMS